jgi:prolyl-tRNA editing enzyme YbaK/EbsC (Cys-tRNA(Pro) deacylase)
MDEKLHKNTRRAQAAIEAGGLEVTVRVLQESARTVAEAAASIGVEEGQIAKSLVFLADGEPVMVVASGDEQVDTSALGALIGKKITRADADSVRAATGYPIGGVSPAGLPETLPVYVEKSLARWDVVWAAAGTYHAVFSCNYDGLLQLTGGTPSSVGITK